MRRHFAIGKPSDYYPIWALCAFAFVVGVVLTLLIGDIGFPIAIFITGVVAVLRIKRGQHPRR